jgi:hypothetical protein
MVEDFNKIKKENERLKDKKSNKEVKKILSSKISYRSGNPLKKLLSSGNRPTVKISGNKEKISLMRATW